MEVNSGAPSTKRAKLVPPATPSSGGLAVMAGSGEGAPLDPRIKKIILVRTASATSRTVSSVRSSPVYPLRKVFALKSLHVGGALFGAPLLSISTAARSLSVIFLSP